MAVMMAAAGVPFFFAYGRDSRQPVATAVVVLIYVAVWALIGLALDYVMGMVMTRSSLVIRPAAVAVALVSPPPPWPRWAPRRARDMAHWAPGPPRFPAPVPAP